MGWRGVKVRVNMFLCRLGRMGGKKKEEEEEDVFGVDKVGEEERG